MNIWLEMITGRNKKRYPAAQVLPWAGFAVLFLLFLWRAFRGFDWSDESVAFAAPYRLLLGDTPLVDSWDSHTGWSIVAAPFLALYRSWKGNMDGILLAGRIAFLFVHMAVAGVVYRRLLQFCRSHLAAMLAGWLTAAFVPGMIFNFSYSSAGLLLMTLSCTTLVWLYRRDGMHTGRSALFAGLFAGLGGVIYPTFLLGVVPMLLMLLLYRPGPLKNGRRSQKPFWCFLSGAVVPIAALLLYLGNRLGWRVLWNYFPWLITDRHNPFSSYGRGIFTFFEGYSQADFLYLAEISILLLMLLAKWAPFSFDLPFRIEDVFHTAVKIVLPVCILANIVLIIVQPDWDMPANAKMSQLLASAGIWPIILCVLNPSRRCKILLLGMYLPGQLMALGAHLSDSPDGFGASFAMLPSMLAAVLIVYENYGPLLRQVNRGSMETMVAVIRTCMALVAFFLLGATIFIRSALAYRDLPVSELHTQLTSGPAQGLYTTEIDAQAYESMVEEIRSSQSPGEKVLIVGNLPFAYLCGDCAVAAPTVSEVTLDSSLLYDYLVQDLDRRPDWIYVPKSIYGYGNEKNDYSLREFQWIASGTLQMQESSYSYIYTAIDDEASEININTLETIE